MSGPLCKMLNWFSGWRWDRDGWLVRARRSGDPDLKWRSDLGFVEEACIAVRNHNIARMIDRELQPQGGEGRE